jgi:hypothetical protein
MSAQDARGPEDDDPTSSIRHRLDPVLEQTGCVRYLA